MKYSVLLVDDEPNILKALVRSLRKEPFDFLTAPSASLALGMMEQSPPDVVISDEMMPGMLGTEFLSHVRDAYPETIRMMLTGTDNMKRAERAMREGAVFRFFRKPFDPLEIGRAIYDGILMRTVSGGDDPRMLMPMRMQAQVLEAMRPIPDRTEPAASPAPAVDREEADQQRQTLMEDVVPKVVAHLRSKLEQARNKDEVVAIFAEIRGLLAQVNSAEHKEEIVAVFREVWQQIESRINQ